MVNVFRVSILVSILVVLLEVLKCIENPEKCLAKLALSIDLKLPKKDPKPKKAKEKADEEARRKADEEARRKADAVFL